MQLEDALILKGIKTVDTDNCSYTTYNHITSDEIETMNLITIFPNALFPIVDRM